MVSKKSFTLIELLIVLVIIGILATLAVPQFERIVLKAKMMKRVPILEQIRVAELAYKAETGSYFLYSAWVEPGASEGDDDIKEVEQAIGVKIPYICDYYNQASSFHLFYSALSGWLLGDPRFDSRYPCYIYTSQGTDGLGLACIIMCLDNDLNVKKLSIKYYDGDADRTNDPVDDIVSDG